MKKDTTGRGDQTELEIATILSRAGVHVLRPLSSGLRYDLAIDTQNGTFARIQCKTGKLKNGVIHFRVAMADGRRPRGVPYHGQVEAFGVYCPDNDRGYLVPMAAVDGQVGTAVLRLAVAKNGQRKLS